MTYDLTNELHRGQIECRLKALTAKGACVVLTEKAFRTNRQNSYLHLLLGVIAMETGNTVEDVKREYFKRIVNPDIFVSHRKDNRGNDIVVYRSSSAVSKEEMSMAIDRLKRWGAQNGIYLPSQDDEIALRAIEIEMGRIQTYL